MSSLSGEAAGVTTPSGIPKRRTYLIDRDFQLRMMRMIVLSGLSVCVVSVVVIYAFLSWLFTTLKDSHALPISVVDDLNSISGMLLGLAGIVVAINLILILVWALVYSNRVAGPVYNMKKTLDAYLAGNTSVQIKLRQKDYFFELAEKINRAMTAGAKK